MKKAIMIVGSVLILAACKKDKDYVCECNDNTKQTKNFSSDSERTERELWCFGIQHEKNKPALIAGNAPNVNCDIK